VDYAIDGSGTIHSLFSNGVTHVVGDLALALFNNPSALTKDGQSHYKVSSNSGEPTIRRVSGIPGTSVIMGALEQSNVDLANEFSDMIVTQRAFQASARIIQTSSDILADLMNLTR
jgi:flagellar hook protein FlgE